MLASHRAPPVFGGAEGLNGRCNHDAIRFWADPVSAGRAAGMFMTITAGAAACGWASRS